MGCNSHLFIETRTDVIRSDVKRWWWLWGEPRESRDYNVYGALAGVRTDFNKPVCEPRGLPDDASFETKDAFEKAGGDFHTPTWLTPAEFTEAMERVEGPRRADPESEKYWGKSGEYLGKDWRVLKRLLPILAEVYGPDNVRLIVAFDN